MYAFINSTSLQRFIVSSISLRSQDWGSAQRVHPLPVEGDLQENEGEGRRRRFEEEEGEYWQRWRAGARG